MWLTVMDDLDQLSFRDIKSLREINIRFDSVKDTVGTFELYFNDRHVGSVKRHNLSDKDISRLISLSEYDVEDWHGTSK